MFVSQVIFESDKVNEELLKKIMKKKISGLKQATGNMGVECWKIEKRESIGYTLVTKWESKEDFKTWMIEEHKDKPHKKLEPGQEKPKLIKTGYQFETVDIDAL